MSVLLRGPQETFLISPQKHFFLISKDDNDGVPITSWQLTFDWDRIWFDPKADAHRLAPTVGIYTHHHLPFSKSFPPRNNLMLWQQQWRSASTAVNWTMRPHKFTWRLSAHPNRCKRKTAVPLSIRSASEAVKIPPADQAIQNMTRRVLYDCQGGFGFARDICFFIWLDQGVSWRFGSSGRLFVFSFIWWRNFCHSHRRWYACPWRWMVWC